MDVSQGPLYSPLDISKTEIRLLKVNPPSNDDNGAPLQCSLFAHSLSNPPHEYVAVSYVWGDPIFQHPVTINGHVVYVTSSLRGILLRFRKTILSRGHTCETLWVDAVCINQNDIPERNSQVAMMGNIYRLALWTFAWLGEESDDIAYVFACLHGMHQRIANSKAAGADSAAWVDPSDTHLWTRDAGLDHATNSGDNSLFKNLFWDGCWRMFERQYWTRCWIAQEIVLSKILVMFCGDSWLPAEVFVAVCNGLLGLLGKPRPLHVDSDIWALTSQIEGLDITGWRVLTNGALGLYPILDAGVKDREQCQGRTGHDAEPTAEETRVRARADEFRRWRQCVVHTRNLLATDPRDKLYCLLGLVSRTLSPDYGQSVEQVYAHFAAQCAEVDQRIDILCYSGYGLTSPAGESANCYFVPSWTPDWNAISVGGRWCHFDNFESVSLDTERGSTDPSQQFNSYKADGMYPCAAEGLFGICGQSLKARGVLVDVVDSPVWIQWSNRPSREPHVTAFEFCKTAFRLSENKLYSTGTKAIPLVRALVRWYFHDTDIITGTRQPSVPHPAMAFGMGLTWLCCLPEVSGQGLDSDLEDVCREFGLSVEDPTTYSTFVDTTGMNEDEIATAFQESLDSRQALQAERDSGSQAMAISIHRAEMGSHPAFMTSIDSLLGWGPLGARKGDFVCVLYGCQMPVLLRRVDDHYIHIGPCWVLGLMDGEAMRRVENGVSSVVEFNIV
jgi:hypothetical protein